jgi:hypothetical protein
VTTDPAPTTQAATPAKPSGVVRFTGVFTLIAGVIMIIAGVVTWFAVQNELAAEHITVSGDSPRWAGDPVDGPLTAFQEAEMISKHALDATGGKTYAQLDQDDPLRATAQTASFLRASLFTSVVAFGVAAMAAGIGVVFLFLGLSMVTLQRRRTVVV